MFMQSAVRFDVQVGEDRIVQLPREVLPGRVEIIVLVPTPPSNVQSSSIASLVGMLRPAGGVPGDAEVAQILDEARTERAAPCSRSTPSSR